jgi:hypothetical protein
MPLSQAAKKESINWRTAAPKPPFGYIYQDRRGNWVGEVVFNVSGQLDRAFFKEGNTAQWSWMKGVEDAEGAAEFWTKAHRSNPGFKYLGKQRGRLNQWVDMNQLKWAADFNPKEIGKEKAPSGDPDEMRIVNDTDQRWFHEVSDLYPSDGKVWDGDGKAPASYERTLRVARQFVANKVAPPERVNRLAARYMAANQK